MKGASGVAGALLLILVAPSAPVLARTPPAPFELAPFRNKVRPPNTVAVCGIRVQAVEDGRKVTDTFGMSLGRAVKGPADTTAWLRSIVAGLGSRGFSVDFDGATTAPRSIDARFTLRTAWLNLVAMNKTITVVVTVKAGTSKGAALDKDYRVNLVLVNWMGSGSEVSGAFDKAFNVALDQIAADFTEVCHDAT